MVQTGQRAPDFSLVGTEGGDIDEYGLRDLTDRGKTVVLGFYVFDFHPACTTEWCSLRDADWLTLLDGVQVVGIGTDRVFSHREFAAEHDLHFPLLSDSDGSVSESYDVLYDELGGHRRVSKRAIVVVDPTRTVRYVWVGDDPAAQPPLDEVQRVLVDVSSAETTTEADVA